MQLRTVLTTLEANRELLSDFHILSLSVFGSVARGEAAPGSDVDILVEFAPGAQIGLFAFARLQRSLSELLGAPVDLVTPDALREEMKQSIFEESVRAV